MTIVGTSCRGVVRSLPMLPDWRLADQRTECFEFVKLHSALATEPLRFTIVAPTGKQVCEFPRCSEEFSSVCSYSGIQMVVHNLNGRTGTLQKDTEFAHPRKVVPPGQEAMDSEGAADSDDDRPLHQLHYQWLARLVNQFGFGGGFLAMTEVC